MQNKGKRFLLFTRLNMTRGPVGGWEEVSVPVGSIKSIAPSVNTAALPPFAEIQSQVEMKDGMWYYSNESVQALTDRLNS